MKILLVGAQLIHAAERTEGQTDMTKIIFALRNFANATKNLVLHELRSDCNIPYIISSSTTS